LRGRQPRTYASPVTHKAVSLCVLAAAVGLLASEPDLFSILKSNVATGSLGAGVYLTPTNQLLRAWGAQTLLKGRPIDLAFNADKRLFAVLNSNNVSVWDSATSVQTGEVRSRGASYAGIAFRPGDKEIWASETTRSGPDSILVIPVDESGKPGELQRIALVGHPVPTGIAFSPDGKTAYVALSRDNVIAVIDAEAKKPTRMVPVGLAPSPLQSPKIGGRFM
jgi:40-residue YVTN family beta-propeller repeat